jgi:hypothetical protein
VGTPLGYRAGAPAVDAVACERCGALVDGALIDLHDVFHGGSLRTGVVAELSRTIDLLDPVREPYRTRPHLAVVVLPPWPLTGDSADDRLGDDPVGFVRLALPDRGDGRAPAFAALANATPVVGGVRFSTLSDDYWDAYPGAVSVLVQDDGTVRMVAGATAAELVAARSAPWVVDVAAAAAATRAAVRFAAAVSGVHFPDPVPWRIGVRLDQLRAARAQERLPATGSGRGAAVDDWTGIVSVRTDALDDPDLRAVFTELHEVLGGGPHR